MYFDGVTEAAILVARMFYDTLASIFNCAIEGLRVSVFFIAMLIQFSIIAFVMLPLTLIDKIYLDNGRWVGSLVLLIPGAYIFYHTNIFCFIIFMVGAPFLCMLIMLTVFYAVRVNMS
jgi:hypothetical protein